jgi:hypothetical protein
MRPRIQDEFTGLPISRQRKYQLRMQRDRRCTECGEPANIGSPCLKHLVKARERQRTKRGLKRRYYGTLSYKLQAIEPSKGKAVKRHKVSLQTGVQS